MELFLALMLGHYLADFPLQPEFVARNKGKVFLESIGFHTLTAHAAIHALIAGLLASWLGHDWVIPACWVGGTHWLIDFGKSWEGWQRAYLPGAKLNPNGKGLYGINIDQALHTAAITLLAGAQT